MKETRVHEFDQGIVDGHEGQIWYNTDDFEDIRNENRSAARELLDACDGAEGDMNQFLRASLRGLEHLYEGYDENILLGVELVVENQSAMSASVLASRYAKLSRDSQLDAIQRGKDDEKAAKAVNTAPVRPVRQISRHYSVVSTASGISTASNNDGPLLRRKLSERNDFVPSAPTRRTSSIISDEGRSRRF
ncbi:MAG: hypothetical protein SGILL_005617 [Bacillariaceae sp.]